MIPQLTGGLVLAVAILPASAAEPPPARRSTPQWFIELLPNRWTPTAMGKAGAGPKQRGVMIFDVPRRPCL